MKTFLPLVFISTSLIAGPSPTPSGGGGGGTNTYHYYYTNIYPASASITVTNLSAGSNAVAAVTGTSNLVFVFGIPIGAAGANGTNGNNGTNGTNGVNGTNGTNGNNGATGPAGTSGTDGVDGVNGTNAVIASHIFTDISSGTATWAHGYGSKPTYMGATFNCVTNDGGMYAGESIPLFDVQDASWSQPYFSTLLNTTNIVADSVSTNSTVARVIVRRARNSITNLLNFTITVSYQ